MERSEQQLLSRIAAGDRAAFAEFYDRHAPRVLGLLVKLLGNAEDAQDVLQETFWQLWCRAGQYDATRSVPEVWLSLIARSRALDHLRQQRAAGAWPAGHEPAVVQDPASALERTESSQQVRAALEQLPDEQRGAITLAFYAGWTCEQVARFQAVPLGTAKTRIRLGMKRLRDLLSG
jgi:RNA polymerase sigma-70 factor (ECF subfamily)